MQFYPDIKPHFSPSAHQAWHNQRSLFIRSYFKGEIPPETQAMQDGTKIHGLIEAGFITPQKKFANNEKEIVIPLVIEGIDTGVNILGKPDSFEVGEKVEFVDYKTGRKNTWNYQNLATDIKMRTTAWLVWQHAGLPPQVEGHIEWIGTQWDAEQRENIPTGETAVVSYVYDAKELQEFTETIKKSIEEINEEYEKWLAWQDTTETVDEQDIEEYALIQAEIDELTARQNQIKERIQDQMTLHNLHSVEHPLGIFYVVSKKEYEYPEDMEFQTESGNVVTLAFAKEVEEARKIAQKNYQANHKPIKVSNTLAFRAKKFKK